MTHSEAPIRTLVAAESANEAEAVMNVLRKGGMGLRAEVVDDADALTELFGERPFDLCVCIAASADGFAADFVRALRRISDDIPCLFVLDLADELERCQLLELGASDICAHGEDRLLVTLVERELRTTRQRVAARRYERLYWESQRRCTSLLDASSQAIAYVLDGMHVFANRAYLKLFGYAHLAELQGLPLLDLVGDDNKTKLRGFLRDARDTDTDTLGEFTMAAGGRETFRARLTFSKASYDGEDCHQVVVQDLSERDAFEQQLRRLRIRDRLTGLYNQQYFMNHCNRVLRGSDEQGSTEQHFMLLIELENFRTIRKRIGLTAGDEVVGELARVISKSVDKAATTARISDQTFGILMPECALDAGEELAELVRSNVQEHIAVAADQSVATTCSVGGVWIPPGQFITAEKVVHAADEACREAIASGGNCSVVRPIDAFDLERTPEGEEDDVDAVIERAIDSEQMALAFQPIVNLHGRSEQLYEVLLRVFDERGASIETTRVFEYAAQRHRAGQLDQWVIDQAIETASAYTKAGKPIRLFIKVGQDSLRDESLLLHVTRQLAGTGIDRQSLVFQLSEDSATKQVKLARTFIEGIRQLGCASAIEHFGSEQESLNALNHLNVDYLKLDASFVEGLPHDASAQETLRNIQEKAELLNKETIATAVQDANSLAVLWQLGVRMAQGHYIQEPSDELSYEFTDSALEG